MNFLKLRHTQHDTAITTERNSAQQRILEHNRNVLVEQRLNIHSVRVSVMKRGWLERTSCLTCQGEDVKVKDFSNG